MSKFYVKWHKNLEKMPSTTEEFGKMSMKQLEMVKADLNAGNFSDWGQLTNAHNGYVTSELSAADLFEALLKYMPFVEFKVFPALSADQSMDAIKKVAAAMQAK